MTVRVSWKFTRLFGGSHVIGSNGLDQVLVVREVDEAELAAVAFLARYSGRTLEAYRQYLRFFFAWTQSMIRRHKVKHDRTREHGALANPGGRPRRINAA